MTVLITRRQGNVEYHYTSGKTLTVKCLACGRSAATLDVEYTEVVAVANRIAAAHECPKIKKD